MGLADLIHSLWNPTIEQKNTSRAGTSAAGTGTSARASGEVGGINISLQLSQGQEYIRFNQSKFYKNNSPVIEGFTSIIPKNNADQNTLQRVEDTFNQSINSYAATQQTLMDKSQQFLQGKRTYGKNIYATQAAYTDDIQPNWVGCYKAGNDGLTEQTDLGNTTLTNCKVRAADLGYSAFALRPSANVAGGGNACFVGDSIDKAQSGGLATKSVVSYSFKKADGANTGGLMMNGQIGMYEDDVTNNLVTDLTAVANCDISMGGKINPNTTVATYGYNCNGTQKSPYTAPPPQPAPVIPTPDGYTKYSNKDSGGNDIIKMADGTSLADLAATCDKNLNCSGFNSGGWVKSVINPQSQWDSVNYNGKQLDLYVKNKNTVNIDTAKQYRLQSVNSTNCLYNNSDGRFGTYQCIDFNDQYWTLTAVSGQPNTYMFKGVNSYYSLYADTNGQFRTAVSDINNPTQQWELVPISGQTDTYLLKNKKTTGCLYNNGDGRFNMTNCVPAYNDQWWKLIPISTGPKPCDQYSDTDKNLPDACYAQMWKEAGCTAPVLDDSWWKQQTKAVAKNDIYLWSTMTDSEHRNACYAPVPVVKTGSTINTGSLWSKPWTRINDGTNANSLSQLNDGTIICTNYLGYVYTRANLSAGWIQISGASGTSISSGWNGKCIDQSNGNKSSGLQMQLWDCGAGNPNQVMTYNSSNKTITVPGGLVFDVAGAGTGNGTQVMQYQSWGGKNQQWVYGADKTLRPQHTSGKCLDALGYDNSNGAKIGIWDCNGGANQTWNINNSILMKGVIQISNGTYVGIGQDNNIYTKTELTGNWTGPHVYGLLSVIQINDGTFIGVGLNNNLMKSGDLNSGHNWKQITCPQSCCVTFISTLNDGSIVGIGTNGLVYTRKTTDSPWVLVDGSMQMSSVTQLKDGTILGTSVNGDFYRK